MLIERVWAANEGRNFHYLIACPETLEALVVDPLNAEACLRRASSSGGTSARCSTPMSTAITPAVTARSWRPPARACWRMRARPRAFRT